MCGGQPIVGGGGGEQYHCSGPGAHAGPPGGHGAQLHRVPSLSSHSIDDGPHIAPSVTPAVGHICCAHAGAVIIQPLVPHAACDRQYARGSSP
jgi:hypothetical protein